MGWNGMGRDGNEYKHSFFEHACYYLLSIQVSAVLSGLTNKAQCSKVVKYK